MSTVDIEEKGPDGLPIIHWWVEREEFEKIQALLDAGGNIEEPGFQGATPLLKAAVADSWPMALFLIERGAFIGAVDRRGMTMPWLAATSRVKEGNPDFEALQKVRAILNERGMFGQYYEPNDVKKRIKEGNWPPK
ncbi:ankyrin repeat domain-containing protein [Vannielia litorea]|nr:ankyrin repeat domain-containing protein [Vannielia litorea]